MLFYNFHKILSVKLKTFNFSSRVVERIDPLESNKIGENNNNTRALE